MSQDLHERVSEILHDAETASGSLIADEDGESSGTDLLETAERASDLLDSSEPNELLEAVGLNELPDGSEPDSIPQAIAQGDPERVEELQRLLHLANLADGDDGDGGDALEGAVGAIRQSVGDGEEANETESTDVDDEAGGEADGEEAADEAESEGGGIRDAVASLTDDETGESEDGSEGGAVRDAIESVTGDDGDESEADESDGGGAREAVESVAEGVSEASGLGDALGSDDGDEGDSGDDSESADETGGDISDRLRSAMESTFSGVGDDLEGLQERLQSRSASSVGGETEDDADAEEDAADEDDGLLGSGLGSDQDRGSSGGATRHSTMAPPPSERADMKLNTRHSTMPDKH